MKKILFMAAVAAWILAGCGSAVQEPEVIAAEEIQVETIKAENESLDLSVRTEPPMMKVQYKFSELE